VSDAPRPRPSRLVLLGHPLGHTLSPRIHGAALASARIDLEYRPLDVPPESLNEALDALIAQGAAGNVTIPHKGAVAARCDRLTETAARAGAVNTFWCDDGALCGDNTDVGGFDASARALLGEVPNEQRVALLGAGGAAAGVLAAVERWPATTTRLWSRGAERASALAARFDRVDAVATVEDALDGATLVVNATPVGLRDDAVPVDVALLPVRAAVLNLVYRPGETAWVRAARARGHRASDGLPMLVEQAALAFERWFGVAADRDAMWRAVGDRPAWMRDGATVHGR
jgi:shikimate dehydrogenase